MDLKVSRELIRFANIGAQASLRRIFDRDDGERFLHDALSSMPGVPAKIGQLLGMRAAKEISAPVSMALNEVKAILDRECPLLVQNIETISDWSLSASIGQTHQAVLKSGDVVAIKVQYPGVFDSLSNQIEAIFGLARFSPAKKYDFDLNATKNFLGAKLLEETNYRLEAANQLRFVSRYKESSVVIPRVYDTYSTDKVLTQSWEPSTQVSTFKSSAQVEVCKEVAEKAAEVFSSWILDSMFGLGVLHTDLNPRNFGFRVDDGNVRLVVYDFGSTFDFPSELSVLLYQWIDATCVNDIDRIRAAMENLGFSSQRLEPIHGKLLKLSQSLFKPLLAESLWQARDWNLQSSLEEILGADKWWFRTAGPPWFMYLMRSIQGWHCALDILGEPIDFSSNWRVWQERLRKRAEVSHFKVSPQEPLKKEKSSLKANYLKVSVLENGEELVALAMPARALEDLEDLLPDHVRAKCADDGIDLVAIKTSALASGGTAQELFAASHGLRTYKVWLE